MFAALWVRWLCVDAWRTVCMESAGFLAVAAVYCSIGTLVSSSSSSYRIVFVAAATVALLVDR